MLCNENNYILNASINYSTFLESIQRVEEITGKKVDFQKVDLLDKDGLDKLFEKVCLFPVN